MRLLCPLDTGFEIRAVAFLGRALYFSVTEAPHNIDSLRVSYTHYQWYTVSDGAVYE